MNSLAWFGVILWGFVITVFGLALTGPVSDSAAPDIQAQDVIFLIAGGMLTCLIGLVGMIGFMGWIPGLRKQQKSCALCTPSNG